MKNASQIVSVISIIHHENRFLFVKRNPCDDIFPGKWQNLGGKVELGETLEQAIRREVYEEIGIELNEDVIPTFVKSYSWIKDSDSPMRLGVIFLLELERKPINLILDSELVEYGWFTCEEAEELDTIHPTVSTGTIGQIRTAQALLARKG